MSELRLCWVFELGNDPLRQRLAQLDAPLIERIDLPDHPLREHAMFVEGNQFAEDCGRQLVRKDCVGRAVAFEDAMRDEPVRSAFRLHLLGRLAERQRLSLREDVGDQNVVMRPERIQRLVERDEIARDQPRSLVNQLVKRMLAVGARLAPVDGPGVVA